MNLLYITFGDNVSIHLQAAFSICSFLNQPNVASVNVITDQPLLYTHLGTSAHILPVSHQELEEWQGPHRFFWRIKIKALEKVAQMYPDQPIVYLDTDTFLHGNLVKIVNGLQSGSAFMHENEGAISNQKSKTLKKMWLQIKHKTYQQINISSMDFMWNAGVVAFPNNQQAKECALALSICDEMCEQDVTRRLIEQYAITVALSHVYGLQEAKNVVAHYWSVKELWNEYISSFFLKAHFCGWTLQATVEQFKTLDITKTPIAQRTRDTNLRFKKWVDKMYPPKNKKYL